MLDTLTSAPTPTPDLDNALAHDVAPVEHRVREWLVGASALIGAGGVVAWAFGWGHQILVHGPKVQLLFPPLTGRDDPNYPGTVIPTLVVAVAAIAGFAWMVRRARWSVVVITAGVGAIAWAVAVTLIDGREAFTAPLIGGQYIRTVPQVGSLGTFLSTFVDRISRYSIHTRGHPPGFVVVLWTLDRIGLGGPGPNAGLVFLGGGLGVVAVLVTVRNVAGEAAARFAAPFVAISPSVIWWSSGDAFFAGVSASAIACVVVATGRPGRAGDRLAVFGGVLFVVTAYLSYGLVLLVVIPIAVGVTRRAGRPLLIAGVTGVGVVAAVTIGTGFVWWDGLMATRTQYFLGVASRRPYEYFLVGNVAVLLLAVGPATVVALTRLRRSLLRVLVLSACAAVVMADLSGMAKGEVERIWLPFFPWIVAATAALAPRLNRARVWFAVHVAVTVLLAVGVRSRW